MDGCKLLFLLVSCERRRFHNARHELTVVISGATIFQAAGTEDPILVQLILGAVSISRACYSTTSFRLTTTGSDNLIHLYQVNVVCTIPGLWWLEKVGRRTPLFYGALWQAIWLLIFASIGVARPPTEYESSGIVMIVAACMFIASFASTWGPGAWVVSKYLAWYWPANRTSSDFSVLCMCF